MAGLLKGCDGDETFLFFYEQGYFSPIIFKFSCLNCFKLRNSSFFHQVINDEIEIKQQQHEEELFQRFFLLNVMCLVHHQETN